MLGEIIAQCRAAHPLVHCINNYVTANDCANLLLACGASPIMADDPQETAQITAACAGLSVSLGTPSARRLQGMALAAKKATELGIPSVLDPVGVGGSSLRMDAARCMLDEAGFTAIRGNGAEIAALNSLTLNGAGIDDVSPSADGFAAAQSLARRTGAVVILSGAQDIVTDGRIAYRVSNGHEMMRLVTGAGCMLTALVGAYLAANPGRALDAVLAAVCAMGICGERAFARLQPGEGNASYRNHLIDAVYALTAQDLEREARYAVYG